MTVAELKNLLSTCHDDQQLIIRAEWMEPGRYCENPKRMEFVIVGLTESEWPETIILECH